MAPGRTVACHRCSGTMSRGYQVDQGHGSVSIPKWVEGDPERSVWTGLKLRGRTQHPVTTYRCNRCGLLESYA